MQIRPTLVALALVLAAAAGWFARRPAAIVSAASSSSDVRLFQMQGTGPGAVLTVYEPSEKKFYVYQGVGAGSNTVYCSFSLVLAHTGGPLDRKNCAVGAMR